MAYENLVSNGTFKGVLIGNHCNLTMRYSRTIEQKHIPRANGSVLKNTGGGIQNIVVEGWIIADTRQEVEDYCASLAISFGNLPGTLIVNDTSYDNCYFLGIDPSTDDNLWNRFSIRFMRNPY